MVEGQRQESQLDHQSMAVNLQAAVDLCDPASNELCRKMNEQNRQRNRLQASSQKIDGVYLVCSDSGDCEEGGNSSRQWNISSATHKLERITADVAQVLSSGDAKTSLKGGWSTTIPLCNHLSAWTPSYAPPMSRRETTSYWAKESRPYEKLLISQLAASRGEITHTTLVSAALKVCRNDTLLALLTLANFTKNMAAIERRQIKPSQIEPSLKTAYDQQTIDSIFHRIEGIADNSSEKYNKEGAIYHFYAACFLASKWGPIASVGVATDNFMLAGGHAKDDRIKDAAGRLGVKCWLSVADAGSSPGFVTDGF